MKYTAAVIFFAIAAIFSAAAEEIAVPLYVKGRAQTVPHYVTGIGFYQDSDKMVWGVSIANLKDLLDSPKFALSLYSDSDNNIKTGRSSSGWDFQLNVNCTKKTMSVIRWQGAKPEALPLKSGDYQLTFAGDVIYMVIRREAIASIPFSARPGCRIIGGAPGKSIPRVDTRINPAKTFGTLEPKLDFAGFTAAAN